MGANHRYNRSAARERQVVNESRDKGWVAYRTPQSRGACDVIRMRDGVIELIQVKTGRARFGPNDRDRLRKEAEQAGGRAFLYAWGEKRNGLRISPQEEW